MADWKVRRDKEEWPAPDAAMIRQWAELGKVLPSDYVYNPVLDKWMYAREVAEISGVFESKKARSDLENLNKSSMGLGCLGFLLLLLFWPAGVVVLIIAIAMSAWYHVKR
jgi:hypothetical protein